MFTGDLRLGDFEGVEWLEFFSTSSKNDQSALWKFQWKKYMKKIQSFKKKCSKTTGEKQNTNIK